MNFGAIEDNYMLFSFKYFYNVPHKFHIFKMRFFFTPNNADFSIDCNTLAIRKLYVLRKKRI